MIQRLDSLRELPVNGWAYHEGDIAHGESPTLDDSGWSKVEKRAEFPTGAMWFRRWIEVPKTLNGYDLTGARIWFQFRAGANGPIPQIIYFNGRRVALGEDLEPIVLFEPAKPGEKVLVAVKLLATVDKKEFHSASARIDFAESRPNPEVLVAEARSARALLPALGAAGDMKQLEAALAQVDLSALDHADQTAFDASLRTAQSSLQSLKPTLQTANIRLVGNSHIDAAWLWPWTETVEAVRKTWSTALQLQREYPQYTFTQSAAAFSDWMCDKYPDMCKQMKESYKEGRWEIVGGMWVEPDLNMPDGESLVRQILIGKRSFKETFGGDVRIGWNPDSFGYTWQLPQIYKKSGIDYFVTQKMGWNDTNQLPLKLFWWQSPDGSRVLTYFPHDYVNQVEPVRMAEDFAAARKLNPGTTEMMHLYGIGDHGGGPTRAMLDSGMKWTGPDVVYPKAKFGTAQSFFSDVETHLDTKHAPVWNYSTLAAKSAALPTPPAGEVSLPVWDDELYFEYHRGVMTTQAKHKRNMREGEEMLLNAEKFSSLAWLQGLAYPQAKFTDGWKKILFNQFHDTAAGSGIAVIYRDADNDTKVVRLETETAQAAALQTLTSYINTSGKGVPVAVFNPLGWQRSDSVAFTVQMPESTPSIQIADAAGKVLFADVKLVNPATNSFHVQVMTDVPALGYRVLYARPAASGKAETSDLKATDQTLENSLLRVVVDPHTGCITSLIDKKSGFDSIAKGGCGNQLQTFKDLPKDYDAWNIDPGTLDSATPIDKVDSVQLVETGPMRGSIRVTRTWQNSKFVQDISLEAGSPMVKVTNNIDWHETHVLLKAAFPLAASSAKATYEIPYGTIQRPTTRNNSFESAQFEVPAMRWADLGDAQHGFTLINESKYGYDAKDNVLRLTLLRSPVWPDPDADRGHQRFAFWLYPHAGDWKTALSMRHGYETNYPLTAVQVSNHAGEWPAERSFVNVTPENVVLTALKKSEDGNALLLRVYEWAGNSATVTATIPEGAKSASVADMMENPIAGDVSLSSKTLTFAIHPYEIQTIRIEYGAPAPAVAAK
ncbi:MAG TPA: glycoside hydrolase family 38 C-terminal domain-containing protein [Acidisarcina sp.]|nr:glycoside hydrolase family 38 C-terminal domain-containing protein [Acidisarcina sp.]